MKLGDIIKGVKTVEVHGNLNCDIKGVNIDSRLIKEGHIFIAIKGTQADGHEYIEKAIEKGAKVVICQDLPENLKEDICYIKVVDTEDIVGQVATNFY